MSRQNKKMRPSSEERLKRRVKLANQNWRRTILRRGLEFDYDGHADMLYASFGTPQEAFSMDVGPDDCSIQLRIHMETYKIVGFDILPFRRRFLARHKEGAEVFRHLMKVLGNEDWSIKVQPTAAKNHGTVQNFIPKLISEMAGDLVAA